MGDMLTLSAFFMSRWGCSAVPLQGPASDAHLLPTNTPRTGTRFLNQLHICICSFMCARILDSTLGL